MLEALFNHLQTLKAQPAWQPLPDSALQDIQRSLPASGDYSLYSDIFLRSILPYGSGNTHPGFMGWVQGGGTSVGMLAAMMAAGMNPNCGGRHHAAIEVERHVIRWMAEVMGFPSDSTGILTSGSSMANFMAVIIASRAHADGRMVREKGWEQKVFCGYAAKSVHGCVPRAFDLAGLGRNQLRLIGLNEVGQMDVAELKAQIAHDRKQGHIPFIIIGTAGSVDTGQIDPLKELVHIARQEHLWLHIDGAFGALAMMSETYRPLLAELEEADSVAFDFHKWMQVPYEAGCLLVRHPNAQFQAFHQSLSYLMEEEQGLASNPPWFADMGPELSRGFKALKVYMTIGAYGIKALGQVIDRSCTLARYLQRQIELRSPRYEIGAPVCLNIVIFRILPQRQAFDEREPTLEQCNDYNTYLVTDLHMKGIAIPSMTLMDGKKYIRAAFVNHRTEYEDIDRMLSALDHMANI